MYPWLSGYIKKHGLVLAKPNLTALDQWENDDGNRWASTGERHGADYDAHEATLWNISTYGACVYSEKRSTTCFLAHSQFDLTIHTDTMMPHYGGAGSHQSWMHTELVQKG